MFDLLESEYKHDGQASELERLSEETTRLRVVLVFAVSLCDRFSLGPLIVSQ